MRHVRAALMFAALVAVMFAAGPVRAASPEPSAGGGAGDTRSVGEAPGFVGAPLIAIGGVLVLGALAVLGTVAYVRLTGGPGPTTPTDSTRPGTRGDSRAAR